MTLTNRLGRPLLAAMFISGGIDQLRDPAGKSFAAARVRDELDDKVDQDVPLPETDEDMVRINGAVQVVAGSLLAMNKLPRLASLALAGTLVPTTLGAHRFWEVEDEQDRQMQQVQFLKNVAMFGGLLVSAGDTGSRPSVGWRTRKAVGDTATGVAAGASGLADSAGELVDSTRSSAREAALDAREFAQSGVAERARRFRRPSRRKQARKAADRVSETLVSTKNAAAPKFAEASESASHLLDDASVRAGEAYERAQPVIENAARESRAKLEELWAALIPIGIAAQKYSKDFASQASDIADKSKDVARDAQSAARGAVDRGSSKVRSFAA